MAEIPSTILDFLDDEDITLSSPRSKCDEVADEGGEGVTEDDMESRSIEPDRDDACIVNGDEDSKLLLLPPLLP